MLAEKNPNKKAKREYNPIRIKKDTIRMILKRLLEIYSKGKKFPIDKKIFL